ncbi:MAG: DUF1330 domain-containing protein [Proteobacteria bacterium TMED72]|nr:MAG: DUF1330 domain-containing protein [Proteobacteria bacterium TMED72]
MPAYLIVNYTVNDAEKYGEYQAGAGPALGIGSDCELVVFDTESERLEGDTAGHQTVILKFESKEKAKEVYESGAYQGVVGTRLGATSNHFAVLVNGVG